MDVYLLRFIDITNNNDDTNAEPCQQSLDVFLGHALVFITKINLILKDLPQCFFRSSLPLGICDTLVTFPGLPVKDLNGSPGVTPQS